MTAHLRTDPTDATAAIAKLHEAAIGVGIGCAITFAPLFVWGGDKLSELLGAPAVLFPIVCVLIGAGHFFFYSIRASNAARDLASQLEAR